MSSPKDMIGITTSVPAMRRYCDEDVSRRRNTMRDYARLCAVYFKVEGIGLDDTVGIHG